MRKSSLSDFYDSVDATPAPIQVLEIQVSSTAGIHGKQVRVAVAHEHGAIDVVWLGKETVQVRMTCGAQALSPEPMEDRIFRFSGQGLLENGRNYVIEIKESTKKRQALKLLATVEFSLVFPQSMQKRGRIFKLKQLIERAIVMVPTPSKWKTFLARGKVQDPNEVRFNAAVEAILTRGQESIQQISGIDIAIAICETELLKEWLLSLSAEDLSRHVGKLESKAKQKGIRESDQITRVVTEIFTR